MNPEELSKYKHQIARNHRQLSLILWMIGALVIGMVGFSFHYGNEMTMVYAPLIHASLEIKLKATAAHMRVVEILSGDSAKKSAVVWQRLDEADWYAQAMLSGGENQEGVFVPLDDPEMRRIITDVRRMLEKFRAIAQHRLSQRETSGVGTEIDRHYDELYTVFIREADEVKRRLQHLMREDLRRFRAIQIILLLLLVVMFAIREIAFSRFEWFRERNFQDLQTTNEKLECEIQERRRAEAELILTGERLRNLSNQLQTIRESEKTRIAREVHDELGQTITALKMELVCLEGDIGRNDQESLTNRAREMRTLIDSIFTSVQRIVTELRPQILDVLGLCDAMDWQAMEYEKRTGIHCRLSLQREEIKLDSELSTTFFRIFQETLTNVARHANATRVDISFREENNHLVYKIKDNGKGMDENQVNTRKSIGLLGIRERVLSWNGETRIASSPGEGTAITVIIPRNPHVQNR
ncbi:MAG: hypothetical protein A3K09_05305 [Nitrospinae bacterium RIFCSPLOWO2_12_FULL_47_7]|nr:MAG: hypothetical protein A3K09_05305 [Nitrospinae bacterium RIFCSPLOWO2_12_FULL_47_7]